LVVDDGASVALLPLIVRPLPEALDLPGYDVRSPEGYPAPVFAGDADEFPAAAIERFVLALRERGFVAAFLRMHPLLDVPLDVCARFGEVVTHGPTVWIDLTADEATQWADYRSTHRNLIRRAAREGQTVTFDDDYAELDRFFAVYAETMERLDAHWADFGRTYLQELTAVLGKRGFFALVEHGGQTIAAGLFTRSCGIVQYHLSGTATAWLRESPTRLLLDAVRRRCTALGDRQLHLGGGVGTREDALFLFKRGFSSRRAHFRSWRIVLDEPGYARLEQRWRERGGEGADGFFPRYRAPRAGG
jgi:hypothetical protein